MKTNDVATTETYAAAYARLARIAEKLKAAGPAAAIDDLVADLREARIAYNECKVLLYSIRQEVYAEVDAVEQAEMEA